jgi:L-2-hydroxyglutarate oxidase LhgO
MPFVPVLGEDRRAVAMLKCIHKTPLFNGKLIKFSTDYHRHYILSGENEAYLYDVDGNALSQFECKGGMREGVFADNRAIVAMETEVTSIRKTDFGYELSGTSVGEKFTVTAKTVMNCAGLYSDKIAAMIGLGIDKLGYRIHYCKGDYFRVAGKSPVKMLVYPVPKGAGLGIHLTPDLGGSVRLGPNAYYVDNISYGVESNEKEFREDVERFLPLIRGCQIQVDSAGVRPKLQGPKDSFRDFVIRHEADRGLPGFVNLVGIESPGLTAAPAIAEFVSEIYENEIKR